MTPEERTQLRELADSATPGPWVWAGNIDTGEPYLAGRAPGMGASVLAVGEAERSKTGRRADDVRSYARDSDLDPEEEVDRWAEDAYGEPIKEPRLWFYTDHLAVDARDHVVFEVAPNATHRDDPKVYRADIVDIRHPDARFIAAARTAIPALLAKLDAVEALFEKYDASDEDDDDWECAPEDRWRLGRDIRALLGGGA